MPATFATWRMHELADRRPAAAAASPSAGVSFSRRQRHQHRQPAALPLFRLPHLCGLHTPHRAERPLRGGRSVRRRKRSTRRRRSSRPRGGRRDEGAGAGARWRLLGDCRQPGAPRWPSATAPRSSRASSRKMSASSTPHAQAEAACPRTIGRINEAARGGRPEPHARHRRAWPHGTGCKASHPPLICSNAGQTPQTTKCMQTHHFLLSPRPRCGHPVRPPSLARARGSRDRSAPNPDPSPTPSRRRAAAEPPNASPRPLTAATSSARTQKTHPDSPCRGGTWPSPWTAAARRMPTSSMRRRLQASRSVQCTAAAAGRSRTARCWNARPFKCARLRARAWAASPHATSHAVSACCPSHLCCTGRWLGARPSRTRASRRCSPRTPRRLNGPFGRSARTHRTAPSSTPLAFGSQTPTPPTAQRAPKRPSTRRRRPSTRRRRPSLRRRRARRCSRTSAGSTTRAAPTCTAAGTRPSARRPCTRSATSRAEPSLPYPTCLPSKGRGPIAARRCTRGLASCALAQRAAWAATRSRRARPAATASRSSTVSSAPRPTPAAPRRRCDLPWRRLGRDLACGRSGWSASIFA